MKSICSDEIRCSFISVSSASALHAQTMIGMPRLCVSTCGRRATADDSSNALQVPMTSRRRNQQKVRKSAVRIIRRCARVRCTVSAPYRPHKVSQADAFPHPMRHGRRCGRHGHSALGAVGLVGTGARHASHSGLLRVPLEYTGYALATSIVPLVGAGYPA